MSGLTYLLRYATLGTVRGPWDGEELRFWTARHDENHVDDKMRCFLELDDCDCGVPPKKPCPTCGIESRQVKKVSGVRTWQCARGHQWTTGVPMAPVAPPPVVTPAGVPVPVPVPKPRAPAVTLPSGKADLPDTDDLEQKLKDAINAWIKKKGKK